jgi:hypothetical protein
MQQTTRIKNAKLELNRCKQRKHLLLESLKDLNNKIQSYEQYIQKEEGDQK